MTSTLGAAFGIAVVTTIYTALSVNHPAYLAATIAYRGCRFSIYRIYCGVLFNS